MHECWALLPALAAVTGRVRIGTLVSPTSVHHPALLANRAATIDRLSGGRMVLGLGLGPAARKKLWAQARAKSAEIYKEKGIEFPANPPTGKALREAADNYLWNNSVDALSAGGGDPQVREGVLRLLSTISAVSVKNSTTNGTATLTITAGPEVFGGEGSEVLTIDATTGMLVKDVSTVPGLAVASTTYESSRVTTAHL